MWLPLLLIAAAAANGNTATECINTANLWYDVCDYTERVCWISNAICQPYGNLGYMANGAARITPTEEKTWTFLVDVVDRLNYDPCVTGTTAKQCIDVIKSSSALIDSNIDPATRTKWSFHNAQIRLNDLTITPLQPDSKIDIVLKGDVSVSTGDNMPKCRVFEVSGSRVSLEKMIMDVSECLTFYQTPDQYQPDDGALVVFSGKTPLTGSVTDCEFVGPKDNRLADETQDAFSPPTTAVRVQTWQYDIADAAGFRIERVKLKHIDVAAVFWDYAATVAPVIDTLTVDDDSRIKKPPIFYKLAYADTLAPDVKGAAASTVYNMSGVVSPAFALFKPSVMRVPRDAYSNRCSYVYAEAALGLLGSLVVLLLIVIFAREAYKIHSDTQQKHLLLVKAEMHIDELHKNAALPPHIRSQPTAYATTLKQRN